VNATQLRILFDHWLTFRADSGAAYHVARLIADLVEAGGFPQPNLDDLYEARTALDNAVRTQAIVDPGQRTDAVGVARKYANRFEKLTAEWVTP
jgi:hypothetical protein